MAFMGHRTLKGEFALQHPAKSTLKWLSVPGVRPEETVPGIAERVARSPLARTLRSQYRSLYNAALHGLDPRLLAATHWCQDRGRC